MRVSALTVDPLTALPMVVLRDDLGSHAVAIGVGLADAAAIATELDGIELERPMTHQLMGDILGTAGVRVACVVLTPGIGTQYAAAIHLAMPGGATAIQDARPSDAFALALRVGADIRVSRRILDSARGERFGPPLRKRGPRLPESTCIPAVPGYRSALAAEDSLELLEGLGDESFGKWKI